MIIPMSGYVMLRYVVLHNSVTCDLPVGYLTLCVMIISDSDSDSSISRPTTRSDTVNNKGETYLKHSYNHHHNHHILSSDEFANCVHVDK